MINTEDESTLRLVMFGAALLAITIRERTQNPLLDHASLEPAWEAEARTIAHSVVSEAQRLRAEGSAP